MASKHNDGHGLRNQQAVHVEAEHQASTASNKANDTETNTATVKEWIIAVGGYATGRRSFVDTYAKVQTYKVQVLRVFSPCDIGFMLRTVKSGTQEVVIMTDLPSTVQRIDSFLRGAYGVVPVVWAFARKGYVGTLVAGLAGLTVENIVCSEELPSCASMSKPVEEQPNQASSGTDQSGFDYEAMTAEKIAQIACDDHRETFCTSSTNNPNESAPTTLNPNASAPTMLNQNESAPTTLDQNGSAPTTLNQNESAPSTLNQNETAPSTLNQNESAPTTLNQNESVPSTLNQNEPAQSTNNPSESPTSSLPTKHNFDFVDKVFFTAFSVLVVNFVLKLVLQRYYFPVLLWGDDIPMIGIYMRAGVETIIMTIDSMLCKIARAIYEPLENLTETFRKRVEWWSCGGQDDEHQEDQEDQE
jgi:hypothetical protein